ALHPGVVRLAALARAPDGPLGTVRLIELQHSSPQPLLLEGYGGSHKPAFPGWDVLRAVGGAVAEGFAFAAKEEAPREQPLLVAGRFEPGGLFEAGFLPGQPETYWSLNATGTAGRAELAFPQGWSGPAWLTCRDAAGAQHEETWDAWDPWPALVAVFE